MIVINGERDNQKHVYEEFNIYQVRPTHGLETLGTNVFKGG